VELLLSSIDSISLCWVVLACAVVLGLSPGDCNKKMNSESGKKKTNLFTV
jgi:hypothetical protein